MSQPDHLPRSGDAARVARSVDAARLPRSVDAAREMTGLRFLFFWGHRPRGDGQIGVGCLSQWWVAPFTVDDVTYQTAEHFMMERKARLFGDTASAQRIVDAATPGEAKALGRRVSGFDDAVWRRHRYDIVVAGNLAKFGQHPALRDFLCATRGRVLVEASPVDRIWGIGLAADDERATAPSQWQGLNLLGFALMEVRDRLC